VHHHDAVVALGQETDVDLATAGAAELHRVHDDVGDHVGKAVRVADHPQ
jgi:hypothetical protein